MPRHSFLAGTNAGCDLAKEINYARYDGRVSFKLSEVAWLWTNQAPKGDNIPDDSPAYAVIAALKGELHSRGFRAPGGGYPKAPNLVGRELLMEIAQAWGEKPPFLFPEKRATTPEAPTTMLAQIQCEKWLIGLMGGEFEARKIQGRLPNGHARRI